MIRPIVHLEARRAPMAFIALEVLAALAIPMLGYVGIQTLLDSTAGTFTESPQPGEPGFRALVDPSPVTAIVLVDPSDGVAPQDRLARDIVFITSQGVGEPGGGLVIVPGEVVVRTVALRDQRPADAVAALAEALRLRVSDEIVVDDVVWSTAIEGATYTIDNPDPIPAEDVADDLAEDVAEAVPEQLAFAVGPVELDAAGLVAYLSADGAGPATDVDVVRGRQFRHELVWQAVLAGPPSGPGSLAEKLRLLAGGVNRIEELPLAQTPGGVVVDEPAAESLLRELVPFPAGSTVGDRLQLRVLGASGLVDVMTLAAQVAGRGHEVVEIGNVSDAEPGRRLIVPLGLEDERTTQLAEDLGAATIVSTEVDVAVDGVVTLVDGG